MNINIPVEDSKRPLDCPLCGGIPEIRVSKTAYSGNNRMDYFAVSCSNGHGPAEEGVSQEFMLKRWGAWAARITSILSSPIHPCPTCGRMPHVKANDLGLKLDCECRASSNPVSDPVAALDKDEVAQIDPKDYLGSENRSNQAVNIVSEPGLYKLIMRSRKPEAKEFQRWVTHEVLPQIRRTGGYIPAGESDSDEDIMARAVLVAQKTIKQKNQQIAEQQTRIDELQPKASAWDNFVDIDDALSVRDSAKLLSNLGRTVGQTELFEWLDRHDWIFRENKHWSARQSRINAGHLMMVPPKSHGTHKDGTPFAFPPTVKVTRKGLALIARRFGEETLQLEYPKAGA